MKKLIALVAFGLSVVSVWSANKYTTGNSVDLSLSASWSPSGVPAAGDTCYVTNTTCTLATGESITCDFLIITNGGSMNVSGTTIINANVLMSSSVDSATVVTATTTSTTTINGSLSSFGSGIHKGWITGSSGGYKYLIVNGSCTNASAGYLYRSPGNLDDYVAISGKLDLEGAYGTTVGIRCGLGVFIGTNTAPSGIVCNCTQTNGLTSSPDAVQIYNAGNSATIWGDCIQNGSMFLIYQLKGTVTIYGNGYMTNTTGNQYDGALVGFDAQATNGNVYCNWHGNWVGGHSDELISFRGPGQMNLYGNITQPINSQSSYPMAIWMNNTNNVFGGGIMNLYGNLNVTGDSATYPGIVFLLNAGAGNLGTVNIYGDCYSSVSISPGGTLNTYGAVAGGAATAFYGTTGTGNWSHIGSPVVSPTPGNNTEIVQQRLGFGM